MDGFLWILGFKHRIAGDQNIGASFKERCGIFGIHPAIDFNHGVEALLIDHFTEHADLLVGAIDELLSAKSGIHTH